MSREAQALFCEGLRGKFPRPTLLGVEYLYTELTTGFLVGGSEPCAIDGAAINTQKISANKSFLRFFMKIVHPLKNYVLIKIK